MLLAKEEGMGRTGTPWGWSGVRTGRGVMVLSPGFPVGAPGPTTAVSLGAGQGDQSTKGNLRAFALLLRFLLTWEA